MTFLRLSAAVFLGLVTLAACSRGGDAPRLMNAAALSTSPDEFSIVPTQPLQAPPSFRELPTPTPGGANLVDPDPRGDVAAALGGSAAAVRTGGVPAADQGLVQYAGRNGVAADIRTTLAAEDLEFRRGRGGRLLERMFNNNVYQRAYREQMLDQHAELDRWRARGVRTPAAPPAPERTR